MPVANVHGRASVAPARTACGRSAAHPRGTSATDSPDRAAPLGRKHRTPDRGATRTRCSRRATRRPALRAARTRARGSGSAWPQHKVRHRIDLAEGSRGRLTRVMPDERVNEGRDSAQPTTPCARSFAISAAHRAPARRARRRCVRRARARDAGSRRASLRSVPEGAARGCGPCAGAGARRRATRSRAPADGRGPPSSERGTDRTWTSSAASNAPDRFVHLHVDLAAAGLGDQRGEVLRARGGGGEARISRSDRGARSRGRVRTSCASVTIAIDTHPVPCAWTHHVAGRDRRTQHDVLLEEDRVVRHAESGHRNASDASSIESRTCCPP